LVRQNYGCPIPLDFLYGLGGFNEPHAAFLKESRTRCYRWGRAVGNPGGWGTRLFVVLPAVPNTPIVLWSLSELLAERMLQRGARGIVSAHAMDASARRC
jgi:hypothetical protein